MPEDKLVFLFFFLKGQQKISGEKDSSKSLFQISFLPCFFPSFLISVLPSSCPFLPDFLTSFFVSFLPCSAYCPSRSTLVLFTCPSDSSGLYSPSLPLITPIPFTPLSGPLLTVRPPPSCLYLSHTTQAVLCSALSLSLSKRSGLCPAFPLKSEGQYCVGFYSHIKHDSPAHFYIFNADFTSS